MIDPRAIQVTTQAVEHRGRRRVNLKAVIHIEKEATIDEDDSMIERGAIESSMMRSLYGHPDPRALLRDVAQKLFIAFHELDSPPNAGQAQRLIAEARQLLAKIS